MTVKSEIKSLVDRYNVLACPGVRVPELTDGGNPRKFTKSRMKVLQDKKKKKKEKREEEKWHRH